MKKLSLTIILYLICIILHAQTGWQRTITNYSRFEYQASNQNWMCSQRYNGWMYFANNKGLLEFDGTRWKIYPIDNAKLRAIYIDGEKNIYVGGLGQFGYFKQNNKGKLIYHCLSANIKKNEIGNIWNIEKIGEAIYFQSDRSMFYYKEGIIKKIICDRGAVCSAYINGHFYIVSNNGIESLLGNKFVPAYKISNIIHSRIIKMLDYNGKLIAVTSNDGIFIFDNNEITPFSSKINDIIKNKQLFCACLSSKYLAIGTVQHGIYLYSLKDETIEHISIENGLQNKSVLSMIFDRDDNLWLGLDNGIDCIHLDSSYYFLNSSKSLVGAGYSSIVYNSNIYLGTNQGIYSAKMNFNPNEDINLKAVKGSEGEIWSLNIIDDDLFGCGRYALTVINNKSTYSVPGIRGVWSIHPLSSNTAIAGSYFGFYILKKNNGKWNVDFRVENGNAYSSKSLLVEHTPDGIFLWSANKENGLYRLKLSADYKKILKSVNLNNNNLPKGYNVHISEINGNIIIASRFGLFRYDRVNDKLQRDYELEKKLHSRKPYTFIMEDKSRNIWFVENNMLKIYSNSKVKEEYRLRNSLIEDFESVTVINDKSAIIGTEDGFSLIQYTKANRPSNLSLQICDVYLPNNNFTLCRRSNNKDKFKVELSYNNNSIGFKYTVTNYKQLSPSLFSFCLIGSDNEEWSEYSNSNYKEFFNLHEGEYTFKVKALSDDGKTVITDSVSFTILPAWYRTWIAYLIYILIILLIGYYIYYYFNKKFKRQKQEFKKINKIKDNRINLLEKEKLERELEYKSEELIRTSLNIVRKNEILQNIRKEATGLNNSINNSNSPELKRKVLRLIGQIDENIAHDDDLKKFQDTFDSVNHDFIRMLSEKYPDLTKRDKLLCVYIKMDLQSKEIAPLLNISLRGVEISRYRLRKKLLLEDRESLSEFLHKIAK